MAPRKKKNKREKIITKTKLIKFSALFRAARSKTTPAQYRRKQIKKTRAAKQKRKDERLFQKIKKKEADQ